MTAELQPPGANASFGGKKRMTLYELVFILLFLGP